MTACGAHSAVVGGYSLAAVCGLPLCWLVSLWARAPGTRAQWLCAWAWLPGACGIFLEPGSNLCLLHWHQGSPDFVLILYLWLDRYYIGLVQNLKDTKGYIVKILFPATLLALSSPRKRHVTCWFLGAGYVGLLPERASLGTHQPVPPQRQKIVTFHHL